MNRKKIIDFNHYYMDIAKTVQERANCLGKKVGAVIIVQNRVVSTGYNGVPENMKNCIDGGCARCYKKHVIEKEKKSKGSGKSYDECICVHAEQNAMIASARLGVPIQEGIVFTTVQPCFGCIKQMLQARIRKVVYLRAWEPPKRLKSEYEKIQNRFPDGIEPLNQLPPLELKEAA